MPMMIRYLAILLCAVLTALPTWASPKTEEAGSNKQPALAEAPVVVFNRTVFVFRGSFLGASPEARAKRARILIEEALRSGGKHTVTIKENPEGRLILIDEQLAFVVTPADRDPLLDETLNASAQKAARQLEQVITETLEARSFESLLKSLGFSTAATLVFALLIWCLRRLRAWITAKLLARTEQQIQALKIGDTPIIEGHFLIPAIRRLLQLAYWLVFALLSYEWLSFVLSQFPYTRPWGEHLNEYLFSVAAGIFGAIVSAIPGLGVAIAIFFLARFFIGLLGQFLERLTTTESNLSWLAPDTVPTTRRLLGIGVWLFALAMAFPYLPGSDTEAFKGLSVLVGLMISIGGSSVVGQGAAGLILIYTRTIRPGEYVRVGDHEGTVVEMGMFTTRIRTGLGEELTLPNSLITTGVTKNYSRVVKGPGYVIDTTVTIGYDTPWRQVEAMLIEAAKRTKGILETPKPIVFQTALSDYYPEYRLVAQAVPTEPRPRAWVLSELHANIQDVFNEYGVQIMSPHYMADSATPKIVPRDQWTPPPAKPDR